MKSLERRFQRILKKQTGWSTYLCFANAVKGQCFRKRTIQYWFSKLVEPKDYSLGDKKQIVNFLHHISNEREDGT